MKKKLFFAILILGSFLSMNYEPAFAQAQKPDKGIIEQTAGVAADAITKTAEVASNAIDSTKTFVKSLDTSGNFSRIWSKVEALAASLKIGAEYIWKTFVKQQIATSITDLVLILIMLISGIYLVHLSGKMQRQLLIDHGWDPNDKSKTKSDYEDRITESESVVPVMSLGFGIFLLIISLVMTLCWATEMITGFINPEYGAMQDLVKMLSNL